jgi:hypothetical protein
MTDPQIDYDRIQADLLQFYDAAGAEAQRKWGPTNPSVDYVQTFHNDKAAARAKLMTARSPQMLGEAITALSKSMTRTAKNSAPETYAQYMSYTDNLTATLGQILGKESPVLKSLESAKSLYTPWYKSSNFWGMVGIGVGIIFIANWWVKRD